MAADRAFVTLFFLGSIVEKKERPFAKFGHIQCCNHAHQPAPNVDSGQKNGRQTAHKIAASNLSPMRIVLSLSLSWGKPRIVAAPIHPVHATVKVTVCCRQP
ncbi:hypothetical protein TW95_gp0297 [Pandoravirus inopinatum]|uniref:Uncharacterized protein n=1 Tax=Pandoravirus inopinatum TaxID=1605721 RepID=A0A0B5J8B6_9VIRU|nr:hypothetical protein TW95_gp0297 [Pandoravirus inopinatum]AJF97031.1 hypothetical protein [Pandoravirus inopinatum]